MATRILGPTGGRRRRRFLFVPILLVAVAALFVIAGAQADPPEQAGLFELDKNAENDVSTTLLGQLGGNINASVTSFTVCQASSTNPSPLPITIQIDAEEMTVGAIANAGGGGCQSAFKRTYSSVTRGVNSTTAASHVGSGVRSNVTQIVTGTVPGDDWDQVHAAVTDPNAPSPNPCSGAAWTGSSAIVACNWQHDPDGETRERLHYGRLEGRPRHQRRYRPEHHAQLDAHGLVGAGRRRHHRRVRGEVRPPDHRPPVPLLRR